MQIERIFNNDSTLTFEDILFSLVEEKIDMVLNEYYDSGRVNAVTSHDEGENVA